MKIDIVHIRLGRQSRCIQNLDLRIKNELRGFSSRSSPAIYVHVYE